MKLDILKGQGPSVDCDVQELRHCYLHMGDCSALRAVTWVSADCAGSLDWQGSDIVFQQEVIVNCVFKGACGLC